MTFQNLMIIIGSVVGFTAFMIWKDQVWAWLVTHRSVKGYAQEQPVARPVITSSKQVDHTIDRPVAPLLSYPPQEAGQPIATTDNRDNAQLPDIGLLPAEVRDIIRFQAKVETLASLYNSGQITNLAKGIEDSFDCSRSSKEESTYQRVKRSLDPLIAKQPEPTPIAGRPTPAKFADTLN